MYFSFLDICKKPKFFFTGIFNVHDTKSTLNRAKAQHEIPHLKGLEKNYRFEDRIFQVISRKFFVFPGKLS